MLELLDKVLAQLELSAGTISLIAVVVEFALRLVKSEKPLSILHLVARVMMKLGAVVAKVGDMLDKVLPQRLESPPSQ